MARTWRVDCIQPKHLREYPQSDSNFHCIQHHDSRESAEASARMMRDAGCVRVDIREVQTP